jgi:broad specificity phosphatase PhoE
MPTNLPRLFLARHGDTAWTDSRQHNGRTDLPLHKRGEERPHQIGERLRRFSFSRVFTSPLRRASKMCELAGPVRTGAPVWAVPREFLLGMFGPRVEE